MAAKDIMNEYCYVAWSIFQPNGGFSENLPLRRIALSVKLAYLRMKVGLLCVFCLLQWCIV